MWHLLADVALGLLHVDAQALRQTLQFLSKNTSLQSKFSSSKENFAVLPVRHVLVADLH